MTEAICITLPLPPKELHAHNTGHWRAKAAPTKRCRAAAFALARSKMRRPFTRGELCVDFFWPNLIRRDTANALQSVKPYIDGIIDAGVLPDDSWQIMSLGHVRSHLDRKNPRVEITVRRKGECLFGG